MPQLPCSLFVETSSGQLNGYPQQTLHGSKECPVLHGVEATGYELPVHGKAHPGDTIYDVVADTDHSMALQPVSCSSTDEVLQLESFDKDALVKIRLFRLTFSCCVNDKCEQELRDVNSGSLLWAIAGMQMNKRWKPYHHLDHLVVHVIRVKVRDLRSKGYLQFEDGSPTRCPKKIRGYLGCEIRCDHDRAGSRPYLWFSTADMHWDNYKEASKPPESVRSDAFLEEFGWQHVCVQSHMPAKRLFDAWEKLGASIDEKTASKAMELALQDDMNQVQAAKESSLPMSPKVQEKRQRKYT